MTEWQPGSAQRCGVTRLTSLRTVLRTIAYRAMEVRLAQQCASDHGLGLGMIRPYALHLRSISLDDLPCPVVDVLDALPVWMAARPQLEVLDAVVGPDTVAVMDDLFGTQRSPEILGHDQAMFGDAASLVGVRMAGCRDHPVAVRVEECCSSVAGAVPPLVVHVAVSHPSCAVHVAPAAGPWWTVAAVDDAGWRQRTVALDRSLARVAVCLPALVMRVAVAACSRTAVAAFDGTRRRFSESVNRRGGAGVPVLATSSVVRVAPAAGDGLAVATVDLAVLRGLHRSTHSLRTARAFSASLMAASSAAAASGLSGSSSTSWRASSTARIAFCTRFSSAGGIL